MGREYCQHMVRVDEFCDECAEEPPFEFWEAARAWAGLAMWCMCIEEYTGDSWAFTARQDALDECRAWQALRDWLNGTPEEWQAIKSSAAGLAYAQGYRDARR